MGHGRVAGSPGIGAHKRINSNLKQRLQSQWADAVEDWIGQDQSVRTGMLDALGDVAGRRVIDIGCSEGRFCRLLASLGADVTGVDLTEAFVQEARERAYGGETYVVGNAEDLADIDDESFDIAVSYVVLVDLDDYRRSIDAAWRVLKPGSRFIVCNIHPMRSAASNFTGWIRDYERKLFYPLDNYVEEGPREFTWWDKPFVNLHRTLSSYVNAFLDAGFVVAGLQEPTPSEEQLAQNPHFDDELRVPNFIIYELGKPAD